MFKRKPKVLTPEQMEEIRTKDFFDCILPGTIKFLSDHYIVGDSYRCVWAIREYPPSTEEQAILSQLADRNGVTLRIYHRLVEAMEQRKILQNATRKNKLMSTGSDVNETIEAEGNLQDVVELLANLRKNKEPLLHCSVFIELKAKGMDALKELQSEIAMELTRSKITVDRLTLRQKEGYLSVLPVGANQFGAQFERVLPASSVANLYPFNFSGKTDPRGIYLGRDKYGTNILVDFDRRSEDKTTSNILILGNSGQGKSYALGSLYHRGQGVEQDEEAFSLFTMAATDEDKPNAYAQYELGRMCRNGIGTAPDQAASEKWYKQAYQGFLKIEQDMADDKLYYRLGQMNLTGTGTKKDPEQARMYFEKAAELGNADAMYGLGKLYLSRDFSGRDVKKAIDYLMAAAGKDHDYAMYTLGKFFLEGKEIPKNPEYALRWLEEAVEKENPYAEYLLGKTLLQGVDLPQDIHRAVSLLEKAAARSNPCAAYALGKALLEGTVLLQNLPRAMELLTFSADQGFSAAQYLLGKVFSSGELLTKDIPKAILYLTRAAEQDHEYAQYLLGKLYLADEGIPKDVNAALYWFTRAADQGNAFAQYQLGKLFLYGREVEQDMEKAISYLTDSADQGNVYAAQLLQSVHSNRNWSAALGSLRLLQHLARIIQNRIEDERKGGKGGIDRKLKRKIDEKKQAHGLKQG